MRVVNTPTITDYGERIAALRKDIKISRRGPKRKAQIFKWQPLSLKQKMVFSWHRAEDFKHYDAIIAEGSIRAGKTVSMALSYVDWAMENFNGENLGMAGKTIASYRRNVLTPLKQMLRGRGYKFKDRLKDNYIEIYNPRTGTENYFYIFGGKDESSQSLVQGITTAGFFFDEVALMPESFVNQATGRCSVEGSKFWFNCNPDNPKHWFRTNWILQAKIKNAFIIHFNMDDNPSLSDKIKERYRRMYSGVFYKRYILGLWVAAEGIIYDMFNEDENVIKDPFKPEEAERLFISIDYGIQNPMTFGLYGVRKGHYHLFKSYYHSGKATGTQKTDRNYADDLDKFVKGYKLKYIIVDPSATSFIAELRQRGHRVIPARNDVIPGLTAVMGHVDRRTFTINPSCNDDITEFYSYVWDEKKAEKGEDAPKKENDHCMDRNRYAIYTDQKLNRKMKVHTGRGAM